VGKTGMVIQIEAEDAIINIKRQSSCGDKCNTCESQCNENYMNIKIKNDLKLEEGDLVELDLEPAKLVKYTFILYTFPLIMFIVGMVVGYTYYETVNIINQEITTVTLGFGMLMLAYFGIWMLNKQGKERITVNKVMRKNDIL